MASVDTSKEKKTKSYVALNGINFDGLKGKPRVEKGDPIPEGVTAEDIKDLLANKDIKEADGFDNLTAAVGRFNEKLTEATK